MGQYGRTGIPRQAGTRRAASVSKRRYTRAQAERLRRQRLKRKRRISAVIRLVLIGLFCGILLYGGRDRAEAFLQRSMEDVNMHSLSGTPSDTQSGLQDGELEEQLLALAADNPDIAEIYRNRAAYPEEMLKALAQNPELTDFVKGYLKSDGSVTGGITEEEQQAAHPLLLQWDSRWGYYSYGESNIGMAGCGPTCLSMVILALTGNGEATPDKLADYSMEEGHYVPGAGTAWSLMTDAPADWGLEGKELGLDETAMKEHLSRGNMIICAMRPGDFTTTGHFIVIYGYNENGFLVNDPNSRERSGQVWAFSKLSPQIRNLWTFCQK